MGELGDRWEEAGQEGEWAVIDGKDVGRSACACGKYRDAKPDTIDNCANEEDS